MPTNLSSLAVAGIPVLPGAVTIPPTTGHVFFVCSVTGNDNNPGTDATVPLATVKQGVALCTASVGDILIVMPGHAETLTGAGALTINKAGISIIGLGNGTNRPTFTLASTATTIAVSAANVLIRNVVLTVSVDAVVKAFNVTAAGLTLDMVDYIDTPSCALEQFVLAAAGATDMTITNCKWVCTGTVSAATQQWILLNAAHRFKCLNCYASLAGMTSGNPANGVIVGVTAASNDVWIAWNSFEITTSTGSVPISLLASSTGLVADNLVASPKTAIAGSVAIANCYARNNYACHVVNKSGLLDPVVDA